MAEYLKIENFGPIVDVELNDIKPLTILIGESGSGKSTIMKVLSLFRWMFKRVNLRSFIKLSGIKKTKLGFKTKPLLKKSGLLEYLREDSRIVYRNGRYVITMEHKSTKVNVNIMDAEDLSLEKICFISDKRSIIPDILSSSVDRHKDNFYLQDTLDNFREATKFVNELQMNFIGVSFKVEKTKNAGLQYKITGSDEETGYNINLRNASSGMQTATPLSVIMEYYSSYYKVEDSMNSALLKYFADNDDLKNFRANMNVGDFPNKRVHIFIEEPELSLYPDNQTALVDFLIEKCFPEHRSYEMTLMMATHSPYIVNYINLLMARAGKENATDNAKISSDKVDVYLVCDGYLSQLKMTNNGRPIIDTSILSDPIAEIYSEYNSLNQQ